MVCCVFVRDMTRTYSQIHRTDKHSQHSSIIWPVWPNGWAFASELSGCEFETRCSHLKIALAVLAVLDAVRSRFPETNEFIDNILKEECEKQKITGDEVFFFASKLVKKKKKT